MSVDTSDSIDRFGPVDPSGAMLLSLPFDIFRAIALLAIEDCQDRLPSSLLGGLYCASRAARNALLQMIQSAPAVDLGVTTPLGAWVRDHQDGLGSLSGEGPGASTALGSLGQEGAGLIRQQDPSSQQQDPSSQLAAAASNGSHLKRLLGFPTGSPLRRLRILPGFDATFYWENMLEAFVRACGSCSRTSSSPEEGGVDILALDIAASDKVQ